jgi:crotonobetainyl-CoA:carnitine CoA-transferase CaiB-like acyl-CoA transferase
VSCCVNDAGGIFLSLFHKKIITQHIPLNSPGNPLETFWTSDERLWTMTIMKSLDGALAGIKVIDLSRILAGPTCTQVLGDLGAEVIKIEKPGTGDDTRAWGPPYWDNTSAYFLSVNRNKESRFLDFALDSDLKELRELIREADILVENFKTGDLKRFGLDYESLASEFPRLIYCSITGFGSTGPYKDLPGYDALVQAMGGLMSITGPNAETPTKVGVAITDLISGLYAGTGILAALHERQSSGLGQHLEIALFDCQVASLANVGMNFLVSGKAPTPLGNHHPSIVPYGTYPCADGILMLAVGNDQQYQRLCQILGPGPWCAEKYQINRHRVDDRQTLESEIADRMRTQKIEYWLSRLQSAKIPAGPIQSLAQLKADPQVLARQLFTTMDDGNTPCIASPLRFSRTPVKKYRAPRKL